MHYVVALNGTAAKNEYVEVGNLKVAAGNLVTDGEHGAKIGAPTDGGLYFQFGSLIGWAGGASGDGTGMPASDTPGYSYRSAGIVVPIGKKIPTTWGDPDRWTGDTGTVPAEYDPCTHYLGSSWRLPTKEEYDKLFENSGYPSTGPWKFENSSATNSTLGLTFPFSGYLYGSTGGIKNLSASGFYWSESVLSASNGYFQSFSKSNLATDSSTRINGFPVRCVQSVSN